MNSSRQMVSQTKHWRSVFRGI